MVAKKEYRIRVNGVLVEVTREVYQSYYRMRRHESFLVEKDMDHGVELYSNLDTDETLGEEMLPDLHSPNVEERAITNVLSEKLRRCISQLPEAEQQLIHAIYYEGSSEHQFAEESGVSQVTIHKRKKMILAKLLKLMKK